jgi:hypothetical protein
MFQLQKMSVNGAFLNFLFITIFADLQQETFHRTPSRTMVGQPPLNPARAIWYSDWRQYLPIKNNSRKGIG